MNLINFAAQKYNSLIFTIILMFSIGREEKQWRKNDTTRLGILRHSDLMKCNRVCVCILTIHIIESNYLYYKYYYSYETTVFFGGGSFRNEWI